MDTDERTFTQVELTLKGHLRMLPAGQFQPLFSGSRLGTAHELETTQHGLHKSLAQYLQDMDEKLNAILLLLSEQSLLEDFPVPILVHELSGAGLLFSSRQDFQIGQGVEAVLTLGSQMQTLAGVLGVITGVVEGGRWSMDFSHTYEREREKIIQFVIDKQREQLRDRRA